MSASFGNWYSRNKEKWNETRRERYKSSSEFRDRNKGYTKKYVEKKKVERAKEREERNKASTVYVRKKYKFFVTDHNGELVRGVTLGGVAEFCGVSLAAIRKWITEGLVIDSEIKGPRGERLYTADMLESVYETLKSKGKLHSRGANYIAFVGTMVYDDGRIERVKLYTIKVLASLLKRHVSNMYILETRGILPKSPYKPSGFRLYTPAMIETAFKIIKDNKDNVTTGGRITSEWIEQGVFNSELTNVSGL